MPRHHGRLRGNRQDQMSRRQRKRWGRKRESRRALKNTDKQ